MEQKQIIPTDIIRINPKERRRLLDSLDRRNGRDGPVAERRGLRCRYDVDSLVVEFSHPAGGTSCFKITPRNLSTNGISFLHGAFVYDHTPCIMDLISLDGERFSVKGHTLWCRYLSAFVYEIGMKFDTPIDVENFVKLDMEQQIAAAAERRSTNQQIDYHHQSQKQKLRVCGKVLVLDQSDLDRKLIKFNLERLGLQAFGTSDPDEALTILEKEDISLAMVSQDLTGLTGLDFVRQLRPSGYHRAVILMVEDDADAIQDSAKEAGCNRVMSKPLPPELLAENLESLLMSRTASSPIHSRFNRDSDMQPLIKEFVQAVGEHARQMRSAIQANDRQTVNSCLRQLKAAGGGYGFDELTIAARNAIDSLQEAGATQPATAQRIVEDVAAIVERLTAE